MNNNIDYTKPGREVLWDCIIIAVHSQLGKKTTLRVTPDEFDDIKQDCYVATYEDCMKHLDEWDRKYPLFNFVYYRAWSAVSTVIKHNIIQIKKKINTASYDREGSVLTKESISTKMPVYLTHTNYFDRPYKNTARELDRQYDIYCGECAGLGLAPKSFEYFNDLYTKTARAELPEQ